MSNKNWDVKPPNGYRLLVSGEVTKKGDLVFPGLKWRTTEVKPGLVWNPSYIPMARRIKKEKIMNTKENRVHDKELMRLVFKSTTRPTNISLDISRILEIAEEAHRGQTRKMGKDKGLPYIIHPKRVAENFSDETLKSIALLHDVIEDTKITASDLLEKGVSPEVVAAVECLSRKENENYLDFILRIKNNKLAVNVKIADIEDNMRDLEEGSRKDKYRLSLYILKN